MGIFSEIINTKRHKEAVFRWEDIDYSATGRTFNSEHDEFFQNENTRNKLRNWVRRHVVYEKSSFFNNSPMWIRRIRNAYHRKNEYIFDCTMANALVDAGFYPVGSTEQGWYFEVKLVKLDED